MHSSQSIAVTYRLRQSACLQWPALHVAQNAGLAPTHAPGCGEFPGLHALEERSTSRATTSSAADSASSKLLPVSLNNVCIEAYISSL